MKETKEAILGALALGMFVKERLKDGIDLNDAMALFSALTNDGKLKSYVDAAIHDVNLIDDEVKAAKVSDFLKLIAEVSPEAIDLVSGKIKVA